MLCLVGSGVQLGFLTVLALAWWRRVHDGPEGVDAVLWGALAGMAAHLVASAVSVQVLLTVLGSAPVGVRASGFLDAQTVALGVQGLGACGVAGLGTMLGLLWARAV